MIQKLTLGHVDQSPIAVTGANVGGWGTNISAVEGVSDEAVSDLGGLTWK